MTKNKIQFGQAIFATLSLLQKRQMFFLFCFCICHICTSSQRFNSHHSRQQQNKKSENLLLHQNKKKYLVASPPIITFDFFNTDFIIYSHYLLNFVKQKNKRL
jgi:hypothetical protein